MNQSSMVISDRTVGRLSQYRRILYGLLSEGVASLYSHQLAELSGVSAAQVRRDMMAIEPSGSSRMGYDIQHVIDSISRLLDADHPEGMVLIGIGNLGRAIIDYFSGRRPNLSIVAAFDTDPAKVNRVIHGCRCHLLSEMPAFIRDHAISVGIITVPADQAQDTADMLVEAGVTGILNFAPIRLRVPPGVYIENRDMTTSLEQVAYFARQRASRRIERI
jgi:redox-sensing transcriptional repressor